MGIYEDSLAAFRSGETGRAEALALELLSQAREDGEVSGQTDGLYSETRGLYEESIELNLELTRAGHFDALEPYLLLDAAFGALEDGDLRGASQLAAAMQAALFAAGQIPDPDDAAEQDLLQSRLREL